MYMVLFIQASRLCTHTHTHIIRDICPMQLYDCPHRNEQLPETLKNPKGRFTLQMPE